MGLARRLARAIRRGGYGAFSGISARLSGRPDARRQLGRAMKTLGGGFGYGALIEPRWIECTLIEVAMPNLPPSLDGYRIAHLTDIHYSFASGRAFLQRIVAKTNALDADMVALTGDFIAKRPANLHRVLSILSDLRSHDGLYATRGNHDHRATDEHFFRECRDAGIKLLENAHAIVRPSRRKWDGHPGLFPTADEYLTLAGVGDLWEGICSPGTALEGSEPSRPIILMSHNPQVAELLSPAMGVDLVLSGHTHGGQVRPLGRSFRIFCDGSLKYVSGLVDAPNSRVFISRGVGTSSMYFRWNCRPEIALIVLRSPTALEGGQCHLEP